MGKDMVVEWWFSLQEAHIKANGAKERKMEGESTTMLCLS